MNRKSLKNLILGAVMLAASCKQIPQHYNLRNSNLESSTIKITQYEKTLDGVRVEALVHLGVSELKIVKKPTPQDVLAQIILEEKNEHNSSKFEKRWFFISNAQLEQHGVTNADFVIINPVVR